MAVTAENVKKLREKTGAGMMDCKKALVEAKGDFPKAEKILKELGLAAAAKRGGRATNEGRVFTRIGEKRAAILELSCETDFVARNETFVALGNELVDDAVERGVNAPDERMEARVTDAISTIKENMNVRRVETVELSESNLAVDYIHGEGGSLGVLAVVDVADPELKTSDSVRQFAFDIALHVAAFNPSFLSKETVEPAYLEEQESVYRKQAESMDKPEKVIEGIIQGKMKKHLAEICLLEQPFVKDDKKSVSKVAEELGKQVGTKISITDYRYFRVGQEME